MLTGALYIIRGWGCVLTGTIIKIKLREFKFFSINLAEKVPVKNLDFQNLNHVHRCFTAKKLVFANLNSYFICCVIITVYVGTEPSPSEVRWVIPVVAVFSSLLLVVTVLLLVVMLRRTKMKNKRNRL